MKLTYTSPAKLVRRVLAAFVVLFAFAPAVAGAVDIKELTTPLGVKVWLVEEKTTPIVALSFSFVGGTASEDDKQRGVTQLVAAMVTDGAGPFSALAFKQRLEDANVAMGFSASFDRLSGTFRALSANREEAFDLLRLALTAPRFEQDALDQRRTRMLSSLAQAQQRPPAVAARTLMQTLFAGHPYAGDPDGTRQSLPALTTDDVRRRAATLLTRSGLIVAAVGDIGEEELVRQIDRTFGALPAGGLKPPTPDWTPPAPLPGKAGRTVVVERNVPQSVVLLALPGVPREDPDWYPAFVMNHILGGSGMGSRLFIEVREKRGLAYGVSSSVRHYRKAALFVASTASANERVAEAIKVARGEFTRLRNEGVSEQELANAKTFLTGSLALALDSSPSIASLMHGMQIDGLPRDHLAKRAGLIAAVKAADVRRVAERVLRDDAVVTIVVGKPVGVVSDPKP
jgi:zinc protease